MATYEGTIVSRLIADPWAITVEDIDGGHRVTFSKGTDEKHIDVMNGEKGDTGETGEAGADGFSPTVSVTEITGGHRVTITDAQGAHVFDVMDGQGGSGGTGDHTQLTNRDAANQHPISAIEGLVAALEAKADTEDIPEKTSDLTNDSGFITAEDIPAETDPTVPAWAKAQTKPTYTAEEVGALPDDTPIPAKTSDLTNDSGFITEDDVPSALSELTDDATHRLVTDAEKAGWNAKYSKPSGGIPKSDLASAVQDSLGLADSALQSESDPVFFASPAHGITSQNIQNWSAKQDAISDLATIRLGAAAGETAYQKPSAGIPKTDLASAVQASLGLADTALQEHQSLAAYRTSADQDVIDAGKVNTSDYAPVAKTSAMTQAVGKGTDGKLYTAPGGGGGEGVDYLTVVDGEICVVYEVEDEE